LTGQLANYHLFAAAQADCLRRLNRYAEAAHYYRNALYAVKTAVEREFLTQRLTEVLSAQSSIDHST
jgi:predicted RNA polymerase sigma factor